MSPLETALEDQTIGRDRHLKRSRFTEEPVRIHGAARMSPSTPPLFEGGVGIE
jgi:hypothetical protein